MSFRSFAVRNYAAAGFGIEQNMYVTALYFNDIRGKKVEHGH